MAERSATSSVRVALDEVLSRLQEEDASRTHRLGVSSLLTKPEFSQSRRCCPSLQVLEDDTGCCNPRRRPAEVQGAPSGASDARTMRAALAGVSSGGQPLRASGASAG